MRLAMRISPSRVSSSTVPISRMYMRTGSVVRPNSASSAASAAAASSAASSSVGADGSGSSSDSASGAFSYTGMPMSLIMLTMSSICSGSTMSLRQVIVDLGVGQVALFLAARDQQLQLRLARLQGWPGASFRSKRDSSRGCRAAAKQPSIIQGRDGVPCMKSTAARCSALGRGPSGAQKSLKFLLFRRRQPPLLGELDQFIESLFGPEFRADPLEQGRRAPAGGLGVRHQALCAGELGQAAASGRSRQRSTSGLS